MNPPPHVLLGIEPSSRVEELLVQRRWSDENASVRFQPATVPKTERGAVQIGHHASRGTSDEASGGVVPDPFHVASARSTKKNLSVAPRYRDIFNLTVEAEGRAGRQVASTEKRGPQGLL